MILLFDLNGSQLRDNYFFCHLAPGLGRKKTMITNIYSWWPFSTSIGLNSHVKWILEKNLKEDTRRIHRKRNLGRAVRIYNVIKKNKKLNKATDNAGKNWGLTRLCVQSFPKESWEDWVEPGLSQNSHWLASNFSRMKKRSCCCANNEGVLAGHGKPHRLP